MSPLEETTVLGAVGKVTMGNGQMMNESEAGARLTILIEWRLPNSLTTVVEKLLTELLDELVRLTLRSINMIDVVLHVLEEGGDRAVHGSER